MNEVFNLKRKKRGNLTPCSCTLKLKENYETISVIKDGIYFSHSEYEI